MKINVEYINGSTATFSGDIVYYDTYIVVRNREDEEYVESLMPLNFIKRVTVKGD